MGYFNTKKIHEKKTGCECDTDRILNYLYSNLEINSGRQPTKLHHESSLVPIKGTT